MKTKCIIHKGAQEFDLAPFLMELKPSRNDLDADGSGRDVIDGYFYRERIADKIKLQLKFWPLDEDEMRQIGAILYDQYLDLTYLDPRTNQYRRSDFYASTFDYGTQMSHKQGNSYVTEYVGAALNITER